MNRSRFSRRLCCATASVLGLYWLVMFTGTHTPGTPVVAEQFNDKILHFLAYGGLAFLIATSWAVQRIERRTGGSPESWSQFTARFFQQRFPLVNYLLIAALAGFYGTFDEVTQKLVERSCDRHDWLADAAGTVTALAVFALVMRIGRKRTRAPN